MSYEFAPDPNEDIRHLETFPDVEALPTTEKLVDDFFLFESAFFETIQRFDDSRDDETFDRLIISRDRLILGYTAVVLDTLTINKTESIGDKAFRLANIIKGSKEKRTDILEESYPEGRFKELNDDIERNFFNIHSTIIDAQSGYTARLEILDRLIEEFRNMVSSDARRLFEIHLEEQRQQEPINLDVI